MLDSPVGDKQLNPYQLLIHKISYKRARLVDSRVVINKLHPSHEDIIIYVETGRCSGGVGVVREV